jgi:hypothetical protein
LPFAPLPPVSTYFTPSLSIDQLSQVPAGPLFPTYLRPISWANHEPGTSPHLTSPHLISPISEARGPASYCRNTQIQEQSRLLGRQTLLCWWPYNGLLTYVGSHSHLINHLCFCCLIVGWRFCCMRRARCPIMDPSLSLGILLIRFHAPK